MNVEIVRMGQGEEEGKRFLWMFKLLILSDGPCITLTDYTVKTRPKGAKTWKAFTWWRRIERFHSPHKGPVPLPDDVKDEAKNALAKKVLDLEIVA